jgi:hypothetical protein
MVFLNKSKAAESNSSVPSFSKKLKSEPKIELPEEEPAITIADFELGKKLGAGKFG